MNRVSFTVFLIWAGTAFAATDVSAPAGNVISAHVRAGERI